MHEPSSVACNPAKASRTFSGGVPGRAEEDAPRAAEGAAGPASDGPGSEDADGVEPAEGAEEAEDAEDAADGVAGSASQETANPARTTTANAAPRTVEPNICYPHDR
ncbi:hypothetical protein GCM10010215_05860 [Streptomyces virginiae]|uniref:Uncharacterized protein n=1 Tax=Streptomyces virginiae TaxID=1961 RepID=A0ABQ3NLH8_STRVG|nr:hypothetical protein GCM10010215_05860 [Streptomyces virginiae]GHI13617.1 hypothetical protein Scinn_30800 [Streptomyces virginiae]GLV93141.1 hypothetical protein Slala04_45950 [Streptomyces lavendulae subsp. lavendulae]